jgi:carotenoid cleavage dioxygenase
MRDAEVSIYLTGNYAPARWEIDAPDLPVEGALPRGLDGAYLRNGPNPYFVPNAYHYPIDGDGMVHGVYLADGRAQYRCRWVRTAGLAAEIAQGGLIYGGTARPLPIPPDLRSRLADPGPAKNVANTSIFRHGGVLQAMWAVGPGYALDDGLGTIGLHDYAGAIGAQERITAHPKICPVTGELINVITSYEPPYLTLVTVGPDGRVRRREALDAPYATLLHDLQITPRYVVLVLCPLLRHAPSGQGRQLPMEWRGDLPTRIALVPRDEGAAGTIWIETDAFFTWHYANAFEDRDGRILLDYNRLPGSPFAFTGTGTEEVLQPRRLHRMTLDPARRALVSDVMLADGMCEFPRIPEAHVGLEAAWTWFAHQPSVPTSKPHAYEYTACIDNRSGASTRFHHGAGASAGEPVHVPAPPGDPQAAGYVVTFVYDPASGTSSMPIFRADRIDEGPLARVQLPVRVPNGFHGMWMEGLRLPPSNAD